MGGWLGKPMILLEPHDGRPSHPEAFSDAAIQFCQTFKLLLSQTTGMAVSLLKIAELNWAVSDCTTLCRRQKTLAVLIPYRRADGPPSLMVDSKSITFLGEGEWQARRQSFGRQAPCDCRELTWSLGFASCPAWYACGGGA